MPFIHRKLGQDTQSNVAAASVSFDKLRTLSVQTGISTIPPTLKYIIFATAYGTKPTVELTQPGSVVLRGTGTFRADVITIRPGSFGWAGTPSIKLRWQAFGL